MEAQETAAQDILKCIQKLEHYNSYRTIPDDGFSEFKECVISAVEWTFHLIQSNELEIAMQLLDLLDNLESKSQMEEILGDHILTFAVNYNFAACHQISWEVEKATIYLDKSLDALARYLGLGNDYKDKTLSESPKKMICRESEPSYQKTMKLSILFLIVRGFLQCGAIKSQSMDHEEALKNANYGKYFLKMFIYNLKEISKEYINKSKEIEMQMLSEDDSITSPYFSPMAQVPELQNLQKFTNSSLMNDFNKFSNEILYNDPTDKNKYDNDEIIDSDVMHGSKYQPVVRSGDKKISGFILWKHNPENNEKYFKREFEKMSRDLGVNNKMTTMWLREFNIGNVMHIKATDYRKQIQEKGFDDYFNVNLVVEIVLTYACCLFSIATENRFICQKKLEHDDIERRKRNEALRIDMGKQGSSAHFLRMNKLQSNPNFIESETYHFTAIELLCAFVEECPLLDHLINSYQKNYFPNLQIIKEEMNESWTSLSTRKDSVRGDVMMKSITEYDYVKLIDEDSSDDKEEHRIISKESRSQIMNLLDESRERLGDSIIFKRESLKSRLTSEKKRSVYRSKGDILAELVEKEILPDDCHNIDHGFDENVRFSIDKDDKSIFKNSTQVCSNSPQSNQRFNDSFNKSDRGKDHNQSPLNFDTEIKFTKVMAKKGKMKSIDAYIQSGDKKDILLNEPMITKSPNSVFSKKTLISSENENIAATLRKKSEHLRRHSKQKNYKRGCNTSRSRKSTSRSRMSSSRSKLSQTSKLLSYDISTYKTLHGKPYKKFKDDDTMLKKMVKQSMQKFQKRKFENNQNHQLNFKRKGYYEYLKSASKANLALKGGNFFKKKRTQASPRVMSMIRRNFISRSQRGESYDRNASSSRRSGKSSRRKKRGKRENKLSYSGNPTGFTRSLVSRSYRELARNRILKEKTRSLSKRLKTRTKSSVSQRLHSKSSANKQIFNKRKISHNDSSSIRIHSANLIESLQGSSGKKMKDLSSMDAGFPQNKQFKELITKMYEERSPSCSNNYDYSQTSRCKTSRNKTGKKKTRKGSSRLAGSTHKSKRKGSRLLGGSRAKKKKSKSKAKGSMDLRAKKKSLASKPLNLNFINSHSRANHKSSKTSYKFGLGSNSLHKNLKNLNIGRIMKKKQRTSEARKNKSRLRSKGKSQISDRKNLEPNLFKNSYLMSHITKKNKHDY